MTGRKFDVVVVGAGTAGANAAYQFARRGRDVLLLDRRPAGLAGAQWQNGVLDRHFVQADVEPPTGPERRDDRKTVHLRARDPRVGPTLRDSPTVSADMAMLGARLRKLAAGSGAELIDEVKELEVGVDSGSGRLRSVTLRREGHLDATTVTADLFVDASGRRGVLRRHSAELAPWCPQVRGDELCSASDVHHKIADAAGAEDFLERHGARPGETVTFVGVSGGFSTCAVAISEDLTSVGILVGCLANGRYSTGPRMVADFCRSEPWVGSAVSSGTGVIPLRRPYARLSAPGIALVGDAACQVFPAHGSGIGIGLIAGTMLARGVAELDDPGDECGLWAGYQAPFQHEHGGTLAGFDVLRRASSRLGGDGVDALIRSGIMDERTTRSGLDQSWNVPPKRDVLRSATRMAANPGVARIMVPALARAQALYSHGSRYPHSVDLDALARWDRRAQQLIGT